VRFSNDDGAWSGQSPVGSTAWTLEIPDAAVREVNVEVRDSAGNVASASDTIGLDRSDPNITTFTIHDPDGTAYTDSLDVTLEIVATDAPVGPFQMRFSNDNGAIWSAWEDYATSKPWTLAGPVGDGGTRSVDIQVNDRAGNVKQTDDGILYNP
jgi:hypothetical protein